MSCPHKHTERKGYVVECLLCRAVRLFDSDQWVIDPVEACASCGHWRGAHARPHWEACEVSGCACAAYVPQDPMDAFRKGVRDGLRRKPRA